MMGEHTDLQKQKAKLELDLGDLSSELDGESSQKVGGAKTRAGFRRVHWSDLGIVTKGTGKVQLQGSHLSW